MMDSDPNEGSRKLGSNIAVPLPHGPVFIPRGGFLKYPVLRYSNPHIRPVCCGFKFRCASNLGTYLSFSTVQVWVLQYGKFTYGKLNSLDIPNKVSLVESKLNKLSKTSQCELLNLSRSGTYYFKYFISRFCKWHSQNFQHETDNSNTVATRLRELSFLDTGLKITLTDLRKKDEEGHCWGCPERRGHPVWRVYICVQAGERKLRECLAFLSHVCL